MSCKVGYNGDIKNYDWGGFVDGQLNPVNPSASVTQPHFVLAGPASGPNPGLAAFRLLVPDDIMWAAVLDAPNVFTDVQTFGAGVRLGRIITVTADYQATVFDFEIRINATDNDVTVTLPVALGDGQIMLVKRIDGSANTATVLPESGDLIDGQTAVVLPNERDRLQVIDGDLGAWDDLGSTAGVLPDDVARLGEANIFTDVNTFTGINLSRQTVTSDTILDVGDYETLVDALAGPVTITLPPTTGGDKCHAYRVKKIDDSVNIVTVLAQGTDLIDDSISLNLAEKFSECEVIDAALGYWDNTGAGPQTDNSIQYIGDDARWVAIAGGIALECYKASTDEWIEQFRYQEV